jgi:hypothetical protein
MAEPGAISFVMFCASPEAPGAPYGDLPPAGYPETYSGTGWIRTSEVGAAFANTNMPVPRLLISPHIDALDFAPGPEASDLDGNLSIDGTLVELHACAVNWGLATSREVERLQKQVADLKREVSRLERVAAEATGTASKATAKRTAKKSTKKATKKSTKKAAKKATKQTGGGS